MIYALVGLVALALLLMIPEGDPPAPDVAEAEPFVWDRDALWDALEERAAAIRAMPAAEADAEVEAALSELNAAMAALDEAAASPPDALTAETRVLLDRNLSAFFRAATTLAGRPSRAEELMRAQATIRAQAKALLRPLGVHDEAPRQLLYRVLYGTRAALEEVLLQMPEDEVPELVRGTDEPSTAPSAMVRGVRVHSGDLLLSRGGAPTSALIARGSDHPGNFSHVALVHVSDAGEVSTVEAHIERGVVVAGQERYFADAKLRVMVLRARADLPALVSAPDLGHRAAERAMADATERHIAYDFRMDPAEPERQFCSEVASANYRAEGVELWQGLTTTSAEGTARWLAAFGVRHFETHGPSDLEYDPSLVVVAEWRDADTLFRDHVDNAVVDALLDVANEGVTLRHDAWMLPVARMLKGYSMALNALGREGPVPEGMSATVALRVKALEAWHGAIAERVLSRAAAWREEHGYRAPYWELYRMAQAARDEVGVAR